MDVRNELQYDIFNLRGSRNFPLTDLKSKPELINRIKQENEKQPIYVICRRGIASQEATKLMIENGIQNVKNITGGLTSWHHQIDKNTPFF